jgi:hypothetical protein
MPSPFKPAGDGSGGGAFPGAIQAFDADKSCGHISIYCVQPTLLGYARSLIGVGPGPPKHQNPDMVLKGEETMNPRPQAPRPNTARRQKETRDAAKQAEFQRQIDNGSLVVRKMKPSERKNDK